MNKHIAVELAGRLHEARTTSRTVSPLRDGCVDRGAELAYAIQAINRERRVASGARVVGRKIAMTSSAVQKQFGLDAPTFGVLFDDMLEMDLARLAAKDLQQPRIEAEVAFVLKRDLDMPRPTFIDVVAAIDFALPAIEIAECRVEGWNVEAFDFVADNSAAGKVVLGDTPFDVRHHDTRAIGVAVEINGELRATGSGAACLRHPLKALWWLAQAVAPSMPLRRGELVMSGSLIPALPVFAGDAVEMRMASFPALRVGFE